MRIFTFLLLISLTVTETFAQQHSVARRWNEVLLESIRHDFARPTVHSRNLFHTSVALYDSWAIFDPVAETYFLGKVVHDYPCPFNGIEVPTNVQAAQEETMSYAAYRLLSHRFNQSPGALQSQMMFDTLMTNLGYDINFTSMDYSTGSYAALGNYLAQNLIDYGLQDMSNEANNYANQYYDPVNDPLIPMFPGNADMTDPNRWQPLTLQVFIDQSGNVYPINTPAFVGAEWGQVPGFALDEVNDLTINQRDGFDYWVFHDPGMPPQLNLANPTTLSEQYKFTFEMVSIWSSHLSADDPTIWDISPASIGNVQYYPTDVSEYPQFYNISGGDPGQGWDLNPVTGQPYQPQYVKRGDYARILAEFWADGPDSETPPGHWFTILNYVSDHPMVEKRFEGSGPILSDLEWDVKSYFAMAGAVHDAAVTAWGIKSWYDYVRPISAIRYMADLGQSSGASLPNYHPGGLPLIQGYVEMVEEGDPLAGANNENVGKIKLYAWKGHDYVSNPETDVAGVDWILAENWWPYQRPSFVTPPFAGYVSGHSTFSRAAAEVMTLFTGDAFFPGGMGEFEAPMNEFLVFEDGPSQDVTLQWATYRDASDQCSLSRIWGGIHPPVDDIPGRLMGMQIGPDAFELAKEYFEGNSIVTDIASSDHAEMRIYPNPNSGNSISIQLPRSLNNIRVEIHDNNGRLCASNQFAYVSGGNLVNADIASLKNGIYSITVTDGEAIFSQRMAIVR
ncbi:MAG: T9SS type A sorting domain-containing protein [Flavobacteriales bacterium]|nr:T9SS type A sorting domain-containing protein [Flavobacteriales bacterium]MCB9192324.1 T9SS type A sorting domain-containing protein [Flavobacteriales bacterium]MCB9203734.1 T9SS type A sorting domain-containing protein [Flavobacteriales bacterium]